MEYYNNYYLNFMSEESWGRGGRRRLGAINLGFPGFTSKHKF
jgi:hypothetical protein